MSYRNWLEKKVVKSKPIELIEKLLKNNTLRLCEEKEEPRYEMNGKNYKFRIVSCNDGRNCRYRLFFNAKYQCVACSSL